MNIELIKREEEFLTLEKVKNFLRVDSDADDELIETMISAVREMVENYMDREILQRNYLMTKHLNEGDFYERFKMKMPKDASEIQSVKLLLNGVRIEVSDDLFWLAGNDLVINLPKLKKFKKAGHIEVEFASGMNSQNRPKILELAILSQISNVYDERGEVRMPFSCVKIYNQFKDWRV